MAYYGIFIILAKVNYPVISGKGPEERNFQPGICLFIHHPGFSLYRTELAGKGLVITLIDHGYLAIITQAIGCLAADASFLEPVVIPGNFIPLSHIAGQINKI